jgi:hypothetical protein
LKQNIEKNTLSLDLSCCCCAQQNLEKRNFFEETKIFAAVAASVNNFIKPNCYSSIYTRCIVKRHFLNVKQFYKPFTNRTKFAAVWQKEKKVFNLT